MVAVHEPKGRTGKIINRGEYHVRRDGSLLAIREIIYLKISQTFSEIHPSH
jgi:hypothetical protein